MKDIFITGHEGRRDEFFKLLETHPDASLVIYTNTSWRNPIQSHHDMLHLSYDDIDSDELVSKGYKLPTKGMIETFLNFSEGKEKLISCCHAGISRSSSTALLVAARAWGVEKALELLVPGRHYPNRLIVYLGCKLLNIPELYDGFADWYFEQYKYDLRKFVIPKSLLTQL